MPSAGVDGKEPNKPGVSMFKRAVLLSVLMLFAALLATPAALAAIDVSPSPAQLEFGEVDLHFGGSPRQSVSFSDTDPIGSILAESATIAGAEPASFQIVSDGCSGILLEMSKSCSVEVGFQSAGAPGVHSATLELLSAEGPVQVPLSGSAITGTLSASPSPMSFAAIPYTAPGSHGESEYNETEQLTIQNSANASTQVQSASITGPDASSFSIQWNCDGVVLGDSNSCNMGIRFQPTSPGPKSASLVIDSDSSASPLVVALSGVGLHGPAMRLNAVQALLGDVTLGSTAEQTFTVASTGDYPLLIQRSFLVSGTPLMFPVLADSCTGQILYPSESCAITVGFAPTTLGEKDASLLFITNTPAITVAGIDGIGVAPEPAPAVSAPSEHTPASSSAESPSPTISAPAQASAAGDERVPGTPAALLAQRPPRLFSFLGRITLDPGADVQCPSDTRGCETLSFILPSGASHTSAAGFDRTSPLLGSALIKLRSGQSTHVRIALSKHAVARLRKRGHLRVRVGVVVQAGATILAQRTWTLKLTSAGAVSRVS
jgi:hypothetical protein